MDVHVVTPVRHDNRAAVPHRMPTPPYSSRLMSSAYAYRAGRVSELRQNIGGVGGCEARVRPRVIGCGERSDAGEKESRLDEPHVCLAVGLPNEIAIPPCRKCLVVFSTKIEIAHAPS